MKILENNGAGLQLKHNLKPQIMEDGWERSKQIKMEEMLKGNPDPLKQFDTCMANCGYEFRQSDMEFSREEFLAFVRNLSHAIENPNKISWN